MLQRLLIKELLRWKKQPVRKPLLIDGARQVGKTYLIAEVFGKKEFPQVHLLDFRREPELKEIFFDSLDPLKVISNIEFRLNVDIDIQRDLILLDEIGECQSAVDSLKYFAESLSFGFVCATGSNLGLLDSFPVGRVKLLELFPLCFEEFLMAAGQPKLLEAFRAQSPGHFLHRQLRSVLLGYYFVGGMPEAVANWFRDSGTDRQKAEDVSGIHGDIVEGYRRDFGKYAGKLHAQHIDAVFTNVPEQLAASQDDSVQRFRFQGVVEKRRRYKELRGPIDWLESANLVLKSYPIEGRPNPPLNVQIKRNRFKLYFFDVGLLGYMLGFTYADQRGQKVSFKGYIAENFVRIELAAHGISTVLGWQQAQAEIEFLHRCADGKIIPVEVKSDSRTRARSLRSYINRYEPVHAVKLTGNPISTGPGSVQSWPLYYAQFLLDL